MPSSQIREFFQKLYGGYEGDGCVALWRVEDKVSAHVPYKNLDAIEKTVAKWDAAGHDVYLGVALRRPGLTRGQRGKAEDCIAVPGFWADLDIEHPGAEPPPDGVLRRCKDRAEAIDILKCALPKPFGEAPTLLVSSGWGLHPYWLFTGGPVALADDEARANFTLLHRRWTAAIIAEAVRRGVKLDNCSNVDRVLRVPGTHNNKVKGNPRPTEILNRLWPRTWNELCQAAAALPDAPVSTAPVGVDESSCPRRPVADVEAALKSIRSKLPKMPHSTSILNKLLKGKALAGEGGREIALFAAVKAVTTLEMDVDPEVLAKELFSASIAVMQEAAWDPDGNPAPTLDDVIDKLKRSQLLRRKARVEAEHANRENRDVVAARARSAVGPSRVTALELPHTNGVARTNGVAHAPPPGDPPPPGTPPTPPPGSRKGLYTDAEWAGWAADHGVTPDELSKQINVQWSGRHWTLWEGRYQRSVGVNDIDTMHKQVLTPVDGYSLMRTDGNKVVRKSRQNILDDVSIVALRSVMDLTIPFTRFDRATRTMYEAVGQLRPITPRFDPMIDLWLRELGASDVERFLDWLATLTFLRQETSALYIEGELSVGKQLLASGLARLYHEDFPTKLTADIKRWNRPITECPILWVDEVLDAAWSLSNMRDLIAARSHKITERREHPIEMRGAVRLLFTANDNRLLALDDVAYSRRDIDAIAERFVHVVASPRAAEILRSQPDLASWVHKDRIAAHILWLRDERPVKWGKRFIVPGQGEPLARQLVLSQPVNSAVCEFVVRFLCGRGDRSVVEQQRGVLVENGQVIVSVEGLCDGWKVLVKTDARQPSTMRIGQALKQISDETRWIGEGLQRRLYHVVRPSYLVAWAERSGVGDADQIQAIASRTNS